MADFDKMVWSGEGLEIWVSPKRATKTRGRKVWVRIQGEVGTSFRIYECLAYARSADLCFEHDDTLKPRKRRKSGPKG